MKNKETLEEYISEVTKNFKDEMSIKFTSGGIKLGAKWQQERSYSEEEVLNFTQTIIQQYKFGNTNIEQLDLLKETLQQFKKK